MKKVLLLLLIIPFLSFAGEADLFKVDQKKVEAENNLSYATSENIADEIYDGCGVIFRKIIESRIEGDLLNREHDDEIIEMVAQVVGYK